jgi:hypothetical protein
MFSLRCEETNVVIDSQMGDGGAGAAREDGLRSGRRAKEGRKLIRNTLGGINIVLAAVVTTLLFLIREAGLAGDKTEAIKVLNESKEGVAVIIPTCVIVGFLWYFISAKKYLLRFFQSFSILGIAVQALCMIGLISLDLEAPFKVYLLVMSVTSVIILLLSKSGPLDTAVRSSGGAASSRTRPNGEDEINREEGSALSPNGSASRTSSLVRRRGFAISKRRSSVQGGVRAPTSYIESGLPIVFFLLMACLMVTSYLGKDELGISPSLFHLNMGVLVLMVAIWGYEKYRRKKKEKSKISDVFTFLMKVMIIFIILCLAFPDLFKLLGVLFTILVFALLISFFSGSAILFYFLKKILSAVLWLMKKVLRLLRWLLRRLFCRVLRGLSFESCRSSGSNEISGGERGTYSTWGGALAGAAVAGTAAVAGAVGAVITGLAAVLAAAVAGLASCLALLAGLIIVARMFFGPIMSSGAEALVPYSPVLGEATERIKRGLFGEDTCI